jgi:hypothetical protein
MHIQPTKSLRPSVLAPVVAALLVLLATAACGPTEAAPIDSAVPTTAAVSTTATTAGATGLADCPFSGTLDASQSSGQADAAVSTVQTSKSGCIDNISFQFSTLPPSWTVAYADGPFVDAGGNAIAVPGPTTLVVTFLSTTYANGAMPATIPTDALDYVTDIRVATAPNGSLQYLISLEQRAQYVTSVSRVPSNMILAIG